MDSVWLSLYGVPGSRKLALDEGRGGVQRAEAPEVTRPDQAGQPIHVLAQTLG